jgi:2-dehydro-3-deoxygalactonokinase
MKRHWIAIDWGTTNFRAFLMQDEVQVAHINQACGLLSVRLGEFAGTLQCLIQPWLEACPAVPIVLAGMVGSQQGWFEVSYAPLPATARSLIEGTRRIDTSWGSPAWIVPGVSGTSQFGQPDVMRGEEVQLLGLSVLHPAEQHFALLPGTHSKHAQMINGEIAAFSTFMSGELFALLSKHSILGRALPQQKEDENAFLLGASTALHGAPFSHLIFSARTRRLAGEIADAHAHSYLSGLLIGYELLALPGAQRAWLVGSPSLTARYQLAAGHIGLDLVPVNGDDCFIRGLCHLYSLLQENAS